MAAHHPGTKSHTVALKKSVAATLAPHQNVRLGSKLHREAVDPRIKPGTRDYRVTLQTLFVQP